MARVTVEDCLKNVKNRFELVLIASKRARELMLTGCEPKVDWDNDKATVVALREIAAGKVTAKILDNYSAEPVAPEIFLEIPPTENDEAATDTNSQDELLIVANEEVSEKEEPTPPE